jgi:hypothetical protein
VLVVVVVAGTAMVTLGWTTIACLLSVSAGRCSTIVGPTLSTEASLRSVATGMLLAGMLLRRASVLAVATLALVWWCAGAVLSRRR